MVEMYYILLLLGQSAQIREIQKYYFLLLFKAGANPGLIKLLRIQNYLSNSEALASAATINPKIVL